MRHRQDLGGDRRALDHDDPARVLSRRAAVRGHPGQAPARPQHPDRPAATARSRGVLERRPYQERPTRYEYALTQKGEDLYPVLLAMLRWGNRYKVDDPPLQLM